MRSAKVFSIKQIANLMRKRQHNEFDCNFVVSGARGNGKSTLIYKIFSRFKDFDPWKQMVYSREDVISLLEKQKFGIIFDDEAISTGYKRDFQNTSQQNLIKMMNMYRDNFNIFASAIPSFSDLDKDMKKLMKIHIEVKKRGLAIIHMANTDKTYSQDPWDQKYNQKLEEAWQEKKKKDPKFSPPYHKLTTFVGYLKFGDLGERQREQYKKIKQEKRRKLYEAEIQKQEEQQDPLEKLNQQIFEKMTKGIIHSIDEIRKMAFVIGYDYDKDIKHKLNKIIKENEGPQATIKSTIAKYADDTHEKRRHRNSKDSINTYQENSLIPDKPS